MEDYYGTGSDSTATDTAPADAPKDNQDEGQTFLLNKSVCPGMKPDDTGSFRVQKVLEKEYECVCEPETKEESSPSEPDMPPSGGGDGMYD